MQARLVAVIAFAAAACSREAPPPRAAAVATPPEPPSSPSPQQAKVQIAADIRAACGIADSDAYFDFDSSRVRPGEEPTLDKLVKCFTSGPLRGRGMRLVGHADPRGDWEYNLVLGGARAQSVESYLINGGLPRELVASSSRGEMDAVGTDERTWAEDRRVDVTLAR